MIDPSPYLPDETPVNTVRLPTKESETRSAATEIQTVGEVRRMTDRQIFALQNIVGRSSLAFLRMGFDRREPPR